jgi:hypothetical protein
MRVCEVCGKGEKDAPEGMYYGVYAVCTNCLEIAIKYYVETISNHQL